MNARNDFLTPEELAQKYPQVQDIGWTSSKIGVFFSAGLLIGKQCKKEKKSLILESSFIELMEYYNQLILKRQVFVFPKM
jgi:hypothetical protein